MEDLSVYGTIRYYGKINREHKELLRRLWLFRAQAGVSAGVAWMMIGAVFTLPPTGLRSRADLWVCFLYFYGVCILQKAV